MFELNMALFAVVAAIFYHIVLQTMLEHYGRNQGFKEQEECQSCLYSICWLL